MPVVVLSFSATPVKLLPVLALPTVVMHLISLIASLIIIICFAEAVLLSKTLHPH
jgi:hypothetical protein